MVEIMHSHWWVDSGGPAGGEPDLLTEPVARDVTVGVPKARCARGIEPGFSAASPLSSGRT